MWLMLLALLAHVVNVVVILLCRVHCNEVSTVLDREKKSCQFLWPVRHIYSPGNVLYIISISITVISITVIRHSVVLLEYTE